MNPRDPTGSGPADVSAAEADTIIEGTSNTEHEAAEAETLSPGTRLGRYVVLEEIGQGGMGLVFSAYDPELNRKVALKLLRPRHRERKSKRSRLLQEAQALAKLAHPNVITVYDVGTLGERVFVAMELVEGDTLKGWLKEKKRRWDEVLSVFIPAGRGLAAAHAANLVHRDFKPENVLIGRDGRVRVMDFGLARPMSTNSDGSSFGDDDIGFGPHDDDELDSDANEPQDAEIARAPVAEPLLTQTGSIMGTPAYMAPEQHLGRPTDPRSDQFSFCVALYQGLYGDRPFTSNDNAELARQKARAEIAEPPTGANVPGWVRRVLVRGLSPDPTDRFESMDVLLDELSKDPRVKRRKILAGAGFAAAVAGGVFGIHILRSRQPSVCNDSPEAFAAVWNPERKTAVQTGLEAVGTEHAVAHVPKTVEAVASALDAYGQSWVEMHREACEATHVRGEQSTRLLELRNNCLQERLDEIDALAAGLEQADRAAAGRAVRAALDISSLSACADSEALAAAVDPPEGDETKRAVAEIRRDLAKVKVLGELGHLDEAIQLAEATYAGASTLEYQPVVAEARFRLGQAQGWRGDGEKADDNLSESAWLGASVKHDSIAAAAASELVHVVGRTMGRFDEGLAWARHAEAAIKRIGLTGKAEADLRLDIGVIQERAGRLAEAEAALRQALELYRAAPATALSTVDTQRALADVRVHQAREANAGPGVGKPLEEAATLLEEAKSAVAQLVGDDHPEMASVIASRARVEDRSGRHKQAIEGFVRANAMTEAALGADDLALVPLLGELAQSHQEHQEYPEAIAAKERIHDLLVKRLGEHPRVANALYDIGTTLEEAGRFDEARRVHERALALWESTRGKDHADVAYALTSLGLLDVKSGEAERAVERLERALKLRGGRGLDPALLAQTQFALAQALHATGGDHPRARELATKARDTFAKGKSPDPHRAKAIDTWLQGALGEKAERRDALMHP